MSDEPPTDDPREGSDGDAAPSWEGDIENADQYIDSEEDGDEDSEETSLGLSDLKEIASNATAAAQAELADTPLYDRGRGDGRSAPWDDFDFDAKTRGETAATSLAVGLALTINALCRIGAQFVFVLTRLLSIRGLSLGEKFWRGLIYAGFKGYYKTSGGDAIGLLARPNGRIEPVAVKWNPDGETPKWSAKGYDLEWGPGSEGRKTDRLGKAPVALFDEDGVEKWETLDARIAEAIDLDQYRPLYTNPTIQKTVIDSSGVNQQDAVADGGYPQDAMQSYQVRDPGELADALVDVSSGEGMDGMRVSFRKFKETRTETATTEEMQRQEDRGRIAEMQGKEELAKKMLIIAGAIIVLSFAMAFVVPKLLGGGGGSGGGGGGVVPIAVNALGSAKLLAGGLL